MIPNAHLAVTTTRWVRYYYRHLNFVSETKAEELACQRSHREAVAGPDCAAPGFCPRAFALPPAPGCRLEKQASLVYRLAQCSLDFTDVPLSSPPPPQVHMQFSLNPTWVFWLLLEHASHTAGFGSAVPYKGSTFPAFFPFFTTCTRLSRPNKNIFSVFWNFTGQNEFLPSFCSKSLIQIKFIEEKQSIRIVIRVTFGMNTILL